MKRPRRAFLYSVSVVLVAGGLFGGARMYLSSSHAATRVALRLNTLLGVPVRVADVDIGIGGGSSLRGLEVFEAEEGRTETPWLSVEEIQADVSALDLLGDEAMPRLMLARAARLNLHFDRNDHLLTHLPKPHGPAGALPPIHVEEGQVTLNQEGRAPMIVTGVTAELSGDANGLHFEGAVSDPYWGDWTAEGDITPDGKFQLTLKTPRVSVTQEKLKALPFVSPKVWKHVELEGVTPVDFTLKVARSLSGKSDVSYRVELDPEETTVHVTSINLHADRASGKVIVEDKQVELRDVHGRAADGKIGVNSTMDFRDKVDQLRFAIEAERLDMHKLPEAWRLPPFIKFDGRLSGKANLLVTVDDHKAWTTGKGEGQIAEVRLFGIKSSKPIPIGLHADGDQFRWNQLQSNGNDASSRQPIPLR